jgi:Na+:H+ antiporter, NhaA family
VAQAKQRNNRLDRPVDEASDHVLGPANAPITLVEYGSYACPHCRAANERIAEARDQLGDRLRYVFRHRPLTGSDLARRAAELAERATDERTFWDAHIALMTRSGELTEDDLVAIAGDLGLPPDTSKAGKAQIKHAKERVEADEKSARESGVMFTPTFFINGRRYDGPWDESSFADALLGRLGHRVRTAALDFAAWAPSAGILLLLATVLAIIIANSPLGPGFEAFWQQYFGFSLGAARFELSLLHWVNDGLLTIFFLVVGLEIKREFTVSHLSSPRSAALPIAAAIGGMVVPAALYIALIPAGDLARGWGVPMATDTAFAIALIAMMGSRVPVELRIFLTAAAIVDDIGAILVVALFYSHGVHVEYLIAAAAIVVLLAMLNHAHVYSVAPWCCGFSCTKAVCTPPLPAFSSLCLFRRGRRPISTA